MKAKPLFFKPTVRDSGQRDIRASGFGVEYNVFSRDAHTWAILVDDEYWPCESTRDAAISRCEENHQRIFRESVDDSHCDVSDIAIPRDLSLRDYFAAQTLNGCLSYSMNDGNGNFVNNCSPKALARVCYEYADAMMVVRDLKQEDQSTSNKKE